ncbi:MAG: DeoR/GlpR family DNA-binding transcription regulator [Treponema sp.]|jgi:DeoR family ulaG and ulaABCDEF operon transcriptional repressor|nr:DeoR/GlpR family DNA-binding transcription regulator [Treponema sp.]
MLISERERTILNYLSEKNFSSIHELIKRTNASQATLRRDLDRLEKNGLIKKVRGGAMIAEDNKIPESMIVFDPSSTPYDMQQPFDIRMHNNVRKKMCIAKEAAALCGNNETILIDGGTTSYFMTKFLKNSSINILTNSIIIAYELVRTNNKIVISEGIITPNNMLILDFINKNPFSHFNISKAFIPVEGFNFHGPISSDMFHMRMKSSLIAQSDSVIILLDSSKFDRNGTLRLCELDQIDTVITDKDIPSRYIELFKAKNIRLIIAKEETPQAI